MGFGSILGGLLKGKALATVIVGTALVGGASVAAATPAGQQVMQSTVIGSHATPGATNAGNDHKNAVGAKGCPGQVEAQNLVKQFGLSMSEKGKGIQAICELHQGTFKGMTSKGEAVNSSKKLGYGEINQVLTYAKYLAEHGTTGGKLTDDNIWTSIADALKNCGSTPFMKCLQDKIPGYQPGNDQGNDNSNNQGNGQGKPNGAPTPPAQGKPDGTPTPHN